MIRQRRASPVPGVLAIVILGLVGTSCGEDTPASAYELTGRVTIELTESGDPMPIGGALVTFTSDTGLAQDTQTGDDGRYEMSVLSDSVFGQVRAEASGFETAERTVYFDGAERRIDLVLRPAASP